MSKDTARGVMGILLMLILAGFGWALFYYSIPPTSRDLIIVIVTMLATKGATIYDYFFGGSQSSADKNAIIQTQADALNIAAQAGVPPKVP